MSSMAKMIMERIPIASQTNENYEISSAQGSEPRGAWSVYEGRIKCGRLGFI